MSLRLVHTIPLPENTGLGDFECAAVNRAGQLFVTHSVSNTLDVIDCASDRYLHSIKGLPGVAVPLVSDERGLVFTSNRQDNTVGIYRPGSGAGVVKVPVGMQPYGLAFNPRQGYLLVANMGEPDDPGTFSLSVVDIISHKVKTTIQTPGRPRCVVFDPCVDAFYITIAAPPQIAVVDASHPERIERTIPVQSGGPRGLELDAKNGRLYCACDSRKLLVLDPADGRVLSEMKLSGSPDMLFYHRALSRLYAAISDPGVIDVFDALSLTRLETVYTERGVRTIALDMQRSKVYAFLPRSHRVFVYQEMNPQREEFDTPCREVVPSG